MDLTRLPVDDRGLLYAEACFETFRVIEGKIFCWQGHLTRLARGLASFGLAVPEGLHGRCLNAAAIHGEDTLVRVTVTGGSGPWGIPPPVERHCGVYLCTRPFVPPGKKISLQPLPWPFPVRPRPAKFTADYAETLRALKLLQGRLKMHHTPLMCDDGHILSTPTANVLVYRQGQWWTPAGDGVLPGIVRGALLDSGVVLDAHCPVDWLEECEALALCNSGYFILPVTRVHERDLPESGSAFELLYRVLSGRPGVPAELPCSE